MDLIETNEQANTIYQFYKFYTKKWKLSCNAQLNLYFDALVNREALLKLYEKQVGGFHYNIIIFLLKNETR